MKQHKEIMEMTKIAVISALYVAISLAIAPFGYGAIQFRLSEMFNHLILFNKRYVASMIIGCVIVNMFSPLGIYDMVFGVAGTLISSFGIYWFSRYVNRKHSNMKMLYRYIISSVICAFSMIPVAFELMLVTHVPFWATLGTTALGELVSCLIGAVVIQAISKRVDLTK